MRFPRNWSILTFVETMEKLLSVPEAAPANAWMFSDGRGGPARPFPCSALSPQGTHEVEGWRTQRQLCH